MNRWGAKQLTATECKGQLVAFLYNCRAHILDRVTVDELVQRHRVDRRVAEYELTIAKQKRAGEAVA